MTYQAAYMSIILVSRCLNSLSKYVDGGEVLE